MGGGGGGRGGATHLERDPGTKQNVIGRHTFVAEMTPFKSPLRHIINDAQVTALYKVVTGSQQLAQTHVGRFLQDVLGVLLERLQPPDVVVVDVARLTQLVLLYEVLVDGHGGLVGDVLKELGEGEPRLTRSSDVASAEQPHDLRLFPVQSAWAEELVHVAREQAHVRVTDEHDLLGRLQDVVRLDDRTVSAYAAVFVGAVDAIAGHVEDARFIVIPFQDVEDPLPKAAGVLGYETKHHVALVIQQVVVYILKTQGRKLSELFNVKMTCVSHCQKLGTVPQK